MNPFYVQPAGDYSNQLSGIGDVLRDIGEQRRLREEQDALKEQQRLAAAEAADVVQSGDLSRINAFTVRNPQLSESVYRAHNANQDALKGETLGVYRNIVTASPETVVPLLQDQIRIMKNNGRDTTQWEADLAEAQDNPNSYLKGALIDYAAIEEPQPFQAFQEARKTKETQETWEPLYDSGGNIIGQRSTKTGKVESDPRAASIKAQDKYEPVLDSAGNIIGQKNLSTGKVETDPRALLAQKESESVAKQQEIEQKRAEAEQASQQKKQIVEERVDKATDIINRSLGRTGSILDRAGNIVYNALVPGTSVSGPAGSLAKNTISDSDAANLEKVIDTIKANLSFEALQDMRNSSPTGGALGNVTERELALLGSTVASLDIGQDPDELLNNLGTIKFYMNKLNPSVRQKEGQEVDVMEGDVYKNKSGERIIFRGGQWQKL